MDELTAPERVLERTCEVAHEMARFSGESCARTKLELRGETLRAIEAAVEAGDPLLHSWLDQDAGSLLREN